MKDYSRNKVFTWGINLYIGVDSPAVIYILLVVKISTVSSLLSYQIYVIVHTEIVNTYCVFLFDLSNDVFIYLQQHAQISGYQIMAHLMHK